MSSITSKCPICDRDVLHGKFNKIVFCFGHTFNNPYLLKGRVQNNYICPWCSFDNANEEIKIVTDITGTTINTMAPGTIMPKHRFGSPILKCYRCGDLFVIQEIKNHCGKIVSIW